MNKLLWAIFCWSLIAVIVTVGALVVSVQLTAAGLKPDQIWRALGMGLFAIVLVGIYVASVAPLRRYRVRKSTNITPRRS